MKLLHIGIFFLFSTLEVGAEHASLRSRVLPDCEPVIVDFDHAWDGQALEPGSYVKKEWLNYGLRVSASVDGVKQRPRLFDTANPVDDSSGEGHANLCVGEGGEPDRKGKNCDGLGNVLIIQDPKSNPDVPSISAEGGTITLGFTEEGGQYVEEIGLLDIEYKTKVVVIHDYEKDGTFNDFAIPVDPLGDNSVQTVPINTPNVRWIQVILKGSGAVTHVKFCPKGGSTKPSPLPKSTACSVDFEWVGDNDVIGSVGEILAIHDVVQKTGSYEVNFQAKLSGECSDVGSIRLTYSGNPGNEERRTCINRSELNGDTVFRFPQGKSIPSLGDKKLSAEVCRPENCEPDGMVLYRFYDSVSFEVIFDEKTKRTNECYIYLNWVDVLEGHNTGNWVPGPILGLELVYKYSGSYEVAFEAMVREECGTVHHVTLELLRKDGSPYREEVFDRNSSGIYRFDFFLPEFGEYTFVATAYWGPSNEEMTILGRAEREIVIVYNVWQPSLILIRADNGAEICELEDGSILNLAKLPSQLNIRAKFDLGRGAEGIDKLFPGTAPVEFFIDDKLTQIENISPFAIGGDNKDGYLDFSDSLQELVSADRSESHVLTVKAKSPSGSIPSFPDISLDLDYEISFTVVDEKEIWSPPACG